MADKSVFDNLNSINVNDHTEKKNNLTYLSWVWAWAEVKKQYPDATYDIWRDQEGKPYIKDADLGYMVSTKITIEGLTHEMWLPVMDYNNNAMKGEKYKLNKGHRSYDVEPATMFDVNTAIMRCLVKNLAMFGLGLYIYAGEDLPEDERAASMADDQVSTNKSIPAHDRILLFCNEHQLKLSDIMEQYGLERDMPDEVYAAKLSMLMRDYGGQ